MKKEDNSEQGYYVWKNTKSSPFSTSEEDWDN